VKLGGLTVLRSDAAPESPMLNRILGLGVDEPATEAQLDEALAAMGDDVACYVTVAPGARPPAIPQWLAARGLVPGWGWMTFRRGPEPVAGPQTTLAIAPVGAAEADAFGRIVAAGFGLPSEAAAWIAGAHRLGWECRLALDGDEPVAAAAAFLADGAAYLGLAATLPDHRGKGAQAALLAARIEHARGAGCDVVVTETGERREGFPSGSYRNILRAGFRETEVRANWLRGRLTRSP
jgi:GNAT superfamily N-acetyltransferase